MYISKRKAQLITELTLSLKVASKTHGGADYDTEPEVWHACWDRAEYAHMAIQYLLGSDRAGIQLKMAVQYSSDARMIEIRLNNAGVQL